MNQENVVSALGTLSMVAGSLKSLAPSGTMNGTEIIFVDATYPERLSGLVMKCVDTLTKEIFGTTDDAS